MQDLNDIFDKTKDSIEFSHQYFALQDRHKKFLRDYNNNHESQHEADNQASQPKPHKVK